MAFLSGHSGAGGAWQLVTFHRRQAENPINQIGFRHPLLLPGGLYSIDLPLRLRQHPVGAPIRDRRTHELSPAPPGMAAALSRRRRHAIGGFGWYVGRGIQASAPVRRAGWCGTARTSARSFPPSLLSSAIRRRWRRGIGSSRGTRTAMDYARWARRLLSSAAASAHRGGCCLIIFAICSRGCPKPTASIRHPALIFRLVTAPIVMRRSLLVLSSMALTLLPEFSGKISPPSLHFSRQHDDDAAFAISASWLLMSFRSGVVIPNSSTCGLHRRPGINYFRRLVAFGKARFAITVRTYLGTS